MGVPWSSTSQSTYLSLGIFTYIRRWFWDLGRGKIKFLFTDRAVVVDVIMLWVQCPAIISGVVGRLMFHSGRRGVIIQVLILASKVPKPLKEDVEPISVL